MNDQRRGKDRGKHDGGKDASGQRRDGAQHPESPDPEYQPESGAIPEKRDRPELDDNRHPEDEI